jgi:hypothetical protein
LTVRRVFPSVAVLAALLLARPGSAWIYPEHRNIAGSAIEGLDPARRAALERLWAEARKGHEDRLCEKPWAGDQGNKPGCIDLAAFPALAGDHSCSADELLKTVLETKWVMDVAAVTSVLDKGLATAKNRNEARNRLTRSDLELQRKDRAYATRAGSNNVHFLLTRDTDDVTEFLVASVKKDVELNGLGVWARYHIAAIRLAAELQAGRVPEEKRSEVARTALAAEAFGDHFLEDAFASGHVTGTWGDVATRKGTHDYYNQSGFDAVTWSGKAILLFGDANMKPADLARSAAAVRASFEQVLDAGSPGWNLAVEAEAVPLDWAKAVPAFDTCKSTKMPAAEGIPIAFFEKEGTPILLETPKPGRKPPEGAMPRFRSEIGPFLGLAAGIAGGGASGGFESTDSPSRTVGTMEIGARAGLGLEALLGEAGDGQIFLQAGVLQEIGSKDACADPCSAAGLVANLALRTPARKAITTRIRLPFWLIPGDLIVAAPILGFLAPKTYESMAMVAASGGVIPWQTGLSTFLGRVQFVLGREVGVSFFGYSGGEDQLFVSTPGSTGGLTAISLRTIRFDLPIVEVRPFRSFATTQAAAVLIQIGMGFDKPTKITVLAPSGAPAPDLKTATSVYFRLAFDWRQYF